MTKSGFDDFLAHEPRIREAVARVMARLGHWHEPLTEKSEVFILRGLYLLQHEVDEWTSHESRVVGQMIATRKKIAKSRFVYDALEVAYNADNTLGPKKLLIAAQKEYKKKFPEGKTPPGDLELFTPGRVETFLDRKRGKP